MFEIVVVVGAFGAAIWVAALLATLYSTVTVPRLADVVVPEREWPRVSLVRPACNEASRLEGATRKALEHDYPDLRIILVDDRSDDGTAEIVDRLAADDPRVTAVHIDTLPVGWLGKLNAMQRGIEHADGEWTLFADADSYFAPGTLKRSIAWADEHGTDFVSVLPGVEPAGFLGDAVWSSTNGFFGAVVQPWRVSGDGPRIAATGAFMLVRRSAFDRTPGFEWLRLEVADDFGLCLMIKEFGGRASFFVASESVRLLWYEDFGDMVVSLQKNFFAITSRFSLLRALGHAGALVVIAVSPFGLLAVGGDAGVLGGIAVAAGILNGIVTARWTDRPLLPSLVPWLGLVLTAGIVVRSAIVGVRQGGISWRGVLYRTSELRSVQRVKL